MTKLWELILSFFFKKKPVPVPEKKIQPVLEWFRARIGWNEQSHDEILSKGWKYTKYCKHYRTVKGLPFAWCGMSMATACAEAGIKYPDVPESAISWVNAGKAYDWKKLGIPEGAVIVIQHPSGGRHVTLANRDHKPGEKVLLGLGGNQDNSICEKVFDLAKEKILAVRILEV